MRLPRKNSGPGYSVPFGTASEMRQPPESEVHELLHGKTLLRHLVQPHDPQVRNAHRNRLRNVVVAQVKNLQREPFGLRNQFPFALGYLDARLRKQARALFVQSALGLNRYSQHIFSGFWLSFPFRNPPPPCCRPNKKPTRKG